MDIDICITGLYFRNQCIERHSGKRTLKVRGSNCTLRQYPIERANYLTAKESSHH